MNTNDVILHVEDDANDVELVGMAFRKTKAPGRLLVVNDGDQALRYLNGDGIYTDRDSFPFPSLMLLDLKIPRTSGLEVLAWARSHERPHIKRMPIVVLTSSNQARDIERAYDLGVNSYLIKPAELNVLFELVNSIHHYWLSMNLKPGA